MVVLNRGSWWCFDGKMVLSVRRRDWSQVGAVDNVGAFIGL
jgi:hypothetical protein